MRKDCYFLDPDEFMERFRFVSVGPNGAVMKMIEYQKADKNFYNLSFGDWDETNKRMNVNARTNNGDRDKILATVADSVMIFMEHHPEAIVYARGVTPAKTRLYQIGINKHLAEISSLYTLNGYRNGEWAPLRPG